jgi:hypothetical protein
VNEKDKIPGNDRENYRDNFGLPEGYFDSFNQRLLARIEQEEELKEFPVLSAIPKTQAFITPENYFDSIEQRINERIGQEAKVVSLGTRIAKYKYAIAAVFVLLIGTGVFFRFYKNTEVVKTDTACMELACLTKEEITSSPYFNQISLGELESVAGQDIQDSLNAEINKDLINELLQNPDDLNLNEDDLEL